MVAIDLEQMRNALAKLHDDTAAFLNDSSVYPSSGSKAAKEQQNWQGGREPSTALSQGHLCLEAAADHVFSLTRLLHEPLPSIAPWTCARATLESASYGCWLLTDVIGARTRVARSLALRYKVLSEGLTRERLLSDTSAIGAVESRLQALEDQASRLGYAPVVDKNGKRLSVGMQMPSATKCIADELDMEYEYRFFSAVAHSHPSTLIRVSFQASDPNEPTMIEKNLTPQAVAYLITKTAEAFEKVVTCRVVLYGHDLQRLNGIITAVHKTLIPKGWSLRMKRLPS